MTRSLPGLCVLIVTVSTLTSLRAAAPAPEFTALRKIDVHSHVFEDIPALNAMFRRINMSTVNVCVPGTGPYFNDMHRVALELWRAHPDLFPWTSTFELNGRDEPGYSAKAIAWLDGTFRDGAVAVKIWKEVGIELKKPDGAFLLPDDPLFDPIYAHLAQRGKPLHAHLAEPIDAWRPLDPDSPHYRYYSTNPQWHLHNKPGYPSHEAIIAARDRIMEKHPTLVVIGAHLGSLEHDLDAIAARFDRFPNFHIDTGARTRNLTRHPSEKVRAFFAKYQDRILYGVDQVWRPFGGQPTEQLRQAHIKRLEERYRVDFDYYAGRGEITYDGRKVEALALPRDILEKFYHANAERVLKLKTPISLNK